MRRDVLIRAIATAVAVDPTNHALRQIYAQMLIEAGRGPEAFEQCTALLSQRPHDAEILELNVAAEALCERTVEAVVASIPDSIDDVIAMWNSDEIDLRTRMYDANEIPEAPIGRLVSPTSSLDSIGGIDAIRDALRGLQPSGADAPTVSSLAGAAGFTLFGPPGSGKKTLIHAFAAEIGAKCLTIPMDDLLNASLDGRAIDMRTVVEYAASVGRCVIHLQDVEELWDGSASHMVLARQRLTEQIAATLDRRILPSPDLIVVATTTRPWRVPATLVTEQRLARAMFIPPPDLYARAQIVWSFLGSDNRNDVDVWEVARNTEGYTARDLAKVCTAARNRASAHTSGVRAQLTTFSMIAAAGSVEASVQRWAAHARLALATTNPAVGLDELRRWLATLEQ